MEWLGLILVLASSPAACQPSSTSTAATAPASGRRCACSACYLVVVFVSIGVMLWLLSGRSPSLPRAFAVGLFGIAAIFYAGFWLSRIVPRYRELPAWVDRYPSGIDYAFWAVLAGALVVALTT